MVEDCRRRLVGSSDSARRGALGCRRHGRVIVPQLTMASNELVVSDCTTAAIGTLVRRYPNVSDPRIFSTIALHRLRLSCSPPSGDATDPTEKNVKIKANCETCEMPNMVLHGTLSHCGPGMDWKSNPDLRRPPDSCTRRGDGGIMWNRPIETVRPVFWAVPAGGKAGCTSTV